MVKPLLGRVFLRALLAADLLPDGDRVTRVVIDAPVDGAVTVHVQRIGDERLLRVIPSLDGAQIIREEP